MKTTELSDKIEDGGCVIEANRNKGLADIDRNEIIKIFENKGIILFKNFNIDKDQIVKFTDLFTLQYANDANRREIRFENPKLHNVDPGKMEMPLHSEASYSPSWPEIVWFYCRLAPKKSGQTTVCDGRSIYKNLSQKTKNFFLSNQIVYKLKIPYERKKNNQSDIEEIKLKPWYIENPGVTDCFIDSGFKIFEDNIRKGSIVKGIKAPNSADKPRGWFDKLNN